MMLKNRKPLFSIKGLNGIPENEGFLVRQPFYHSQHSYTNVRLWSTVRLPTKSTPQQCVFVPGCLVVAITQSDSRKHDSSQVLLDSTFWLIWDSYPIAIAVVIF
jgi:hypothetical protein